MKVLCNSVCRIKVIETFKANKINQTKTHATDSGNNSVPCGKQVVVGVQIPAVVLSRSAEALRGSGAGGSRREP